MAKTPNDFDVRPMTVKHVGGKPAFPVVISMPSKEAGIAIENMGRSSLAAVAAFFYNLGYAHGELAEGKQVVKCAVCEDVITEDEYDDPLASECPECCRFFCRSCAEWENRNGMTMCKDCNEYYEEDKDDGRN